MKSMMAALAARLRSRPDTEHEQALIRIAVGIILFFYLLPGAFIHSEAELEADLIYLGVMFAFLLSAAMIFSHIVAQPGISPARRILGAIVDSATATFFMVVADFSALPLFLVYFWITLANGFRYGARYLVASLVFSVIGFSVVLAMSPFWQHNLKAGLGLLIGMAVLSLYALTLVKRMWAAIERAEAANLAKRRFVSVVSHEMRTPLNAIVNMGDLLRDTELDREQTDMLQTLTGASRVLRGLVEDVLDFSKIEAGKLSIERVEFDLHALINSTAKIHDPQARQKGLQLVISIMPQITPALIGDPHHLRQVLINLIGNAIKFTEKGSITVHVSPIAESDERSRLKFSVRDTGIGISPDAQRRIFDSFAQADETTTRRFGGTGLGTTIAKQLVELMGGQMGVESALGLGSTFWFEIEFEKQRGASNFSASGLRDARVLLISFPYADRQGMAETLSGWGGKPLIFDTAKDAAAGLNREIAFTPPPSGAVIYATSINQAQSELSEFKRMAKMPDLPAVFVVPGAEEQGVREGRVVLGSPTDKRLLFNALHAFFVTEDKGLGNEVVFLSDYLKKRESSRVFRILVADDNDANRAVLQKILERASHQVTLVEDGEQALDQLEAGGFDLAILDRNMPNLGGLDVVRAMKMIFAGKERIPAIILSADAAPEAKREAEDAGASAFLPKPVEATKLLDIVAELCEANGDTWSHAGTDVEQPQRLFAPNSPNSQGGAPILNAETMALLEDLGSGSDFMEKLSGAFVKDADRLLSRIEQGAHGKPAEIRSVVHALKGSCASIGADRMTQYCARVNAMSDKDLEHQARDLVHRLRNEFEAVRDALDDYLAELQKKASN